MDWSNVDLKDGYERGQGIIDHYSFDALLLEVSCNIKDTDINEQTIRDHFENVLKNKIAEAEEIFNDNVQNIVKDAVAYAKMT